MALTRVEQLYLTNTGAYQKEELAIHQYQQQVTDEATVLSGKLTEDNRAIKMQLPDGFGEDEGAPFVPPEGVYLAKALEFINAVKEALLNNSAAGVGMAVFGYMCGVLNHPASEHLSGPMGSVEPGLTPEDVADGLAELVRDVESITNEGVYYIT